MRRYSETAFGIFGIVQTADLPEFNSALETINHFAAILTATVATTFRFSARQTVSGIGSEVLTVRSIFVNSVQTAIFQRLRVRKNGTGTNTKFVPIDRQPYIFWNHPSLASKVVIIYS